MYFNVGPIDYFFVLPCPLLFFVVLVYLFVVSFYNLAVPLPGAVPHVPMVTNSSAAVG